jgi:TatD DNase family protein
MFPYIDTHAHLSMLDERGIETEPLLDSLFRSAFGAIIDIGTVADDLASRLERFKSYDRVRFSAGIWPDQDAIRSVESEMGKLEKSIAQAPAGAVVAVGECGLDRHWNTVEGGADIEGERRLFDAQARLALRLGLPLIVHSREAAQETAAAIAAVPGVEGVIHCFSYGIDEARRFLDLGFYISFAGTVTYKSAQSQREAARFVPKDRLLLETDSPYLAPTPHRGKPAHPGMVEYTYRAVAEIRGEEEALLVETVTDNSARLFSLPRV